MIFNVYKLNVVRLGRKTDLNKTYNYLTLGNNRIITDGSLVRDLGVMINEEGFTWTIFQKFTKKYHSEHGYYLEPYQIELQII